jgi:hypothetical protein
MVRSSIRFKSVASVFEATSDEEKKMLMQVGRMCVLYEDLQVEFAGALAEKLGDLDRTDVTTRRFYFVRRSLATLTEIEGSINQLQQNKEFKAALAWWKPDSIKMWDETVAFFTKKHKFLKEWRNDVGGHFHDAAATYAIENMHPKTIGGIEVYRRGSGADVRMPFAYELVAVAMTKNKAAQQPERDFLEEAFRFLVDAAKHGVEAVQVIVREVVLPRF